MPRKRIRARRRIECLSPRVREFLETGDNLIRMGDPLPMEPPELWREYGAPISHEFVKRNPGRRPWAWWQFDAPGRRRIVEGRISAAAKDDPDAWNFGKITHIYTHEDSQAVFEDEAEFLARHNLLTADELAALEVSNDE